VNDGAIAWAESTLGSPICKWAPLSGGLTSTMLAISDASGSQSVLRLMTNEPWRTHGRALTRREQAAQDELASTPVPAPTSLGLDADGTAAGVSAHLMSRLPGKPTAGVDDASLTAMAEMLATIHEVQPSEPFRTYQSWAWDAKWVIPRWTQHPASWRRAFDILGDVPPGYESSFLHRDFSHRNLLWSEGAISGVVDWVETSTGPVWLDAGHAATNLAIAFGPGPATGFLAAYAALTGRRPDTYWLIMDAVGFLPPPGKKPLFGTPTELARLDGWLHDLLTRGLT
jgi:aminoglycoside phosphotransferase (APT) family kinase protein